MSAKKFYVDVDFLGNSLLNAAFETLATDPVSPVSGQFWLNTSENKVKYFDGSEVKVIGGVRTDIHVRVATTHPIAIAGVSVSGLDVNSVIDGVALQAGDLVLVKNQDGTFYGSGPSDNGIYEVQPTVNTPVRWSGMNAPDEFNNAWVLVEQGTNNGGSIWQCTAVNPVVGADPVYFVDRNTGDSARPPAYYVDVVASTSGTFDTGTGASMMLIHAYEGPPFVEVGIYAENNGGIVTWETNVTFTGRIICIPLDSIAN